MKAQDAIMLAEEYKKLYYCCRELRDDIRVKPDQSIQIDTSTNLIDRLDECLEIIHRNDAITDFLYPEEDDE